MSDLTPPLSTSFTEQGVSLKLVLADSINLVDPGIPISAF